MLLGQAYIQMEDYRQALTPIKTGVNKVRAQGNVPKENWLLLLRVCYFELDDYPKMIDTLLELLAHYPKDTYYLTLAGAYSEQGETMKQLVISEVLYEKGLITNPAYITSMASLYLLHEVPYKAAILMEKEIADEHIEANVRNLRMLSQAWYQAREDRKAIPPLARAAAMSDDGELYIPPFPVLPESGTMGQCLECIEQGPEMGWCAAPGYRQRDVGHGTDESEKVRTCG